MTYSIATYFDEKNWQKFGLNWARSAWPIAKSTNSKVLIINQGLSDESLDTIETINGFNFDIVPLERNKYQTLAKYVENSNFLFVEPNILPKEGLCLKTDVACNTFSETNLMNMVKPIRSLVDRAKAIKALSDRQLVCSKSILATSIFWIAFSAFNNYLEDKNYLDQQIECDNLILNLYLSSMPSIAMEMIK